MISMRIPFLWILAFMLYSQEAFLQSVGIGTETPTQKLDVNGGLRIGSTNTANTGAIRWNETRSDFEGYNGAAWVSLTGGKSKWGNQASYSTEDDGSDIYLIGSDNPSTELGKDIAAEGDWLIAGCYRDGVPGQQSKFAAGSIRLLNRNGDIWNWQASAYDPDETTNDFFGFSVDISSTHIIAGAIFADMPNAQEQGKAYIYSYGPNLNLQATLLASDGQAFDYFGCSVSIHGDYAVVGAPGNDILGISNMGRTYVFTRSGTTWNQTFTLTPSDGVANDGYGSGVKLWGDYLAVASPPKTINGSIGAGKVYVYRRNGSNWTLIQQLVSPEVQTNERFGDEIEIRDHKLFIGAPDNVSGNGNGLGKVYIYQLTNSTVTYESSLTPSDGQSGYSFGSAIDFLDHTLLVGAHTADDGATADAGKAYVFNLSNNQWVEEAKLKSSRGEIGMLFGRSVALAPGFAIVSAPKADLVYAPDNGQLFFFKQY